jgi:hypothetical protein
MILYEDNYYLLYIKDQDGSGVIVMGIRKGREHGNYDHLLFVRVSSLAEHINELSNLSKVKAHKAIERGNVSSYLQHSLDHAIQIFANIDMAMKPPKEYGSKHYNNLPDTPGDDLPF